jgi:serine/threonine protein kinase
MSFQQIEDLFHRALDVAPESREAFVREQSAGDDRLASDVLSLLTSDRASGVFSGAARRLNDLAETPQAASLIGQRVGAYEIQREIGRGGMGAVYLAERADDAYRQKVAIKFVGAGWISPIVEARFREERQILANLNHPYIARLLDGGALHDGRPYLVMEFVDGVVLSEFVGRSPSLEDRAALILKVCEAVQYAHQNLVIHRDLKPANILVEADSSPKLLDFGIARLEEVEASAATEAGWRMMTPEYANPEQFLGERVTTSADVYSLGAVLYELVAGAPPFDLASKSARESRELICETDPVHPSTRNPQLRGRLASDLDVIALKALRKKPAERYASVAELIADLDRALSGQPVLARDYTRVQKLARFLVQHRIETAAAALVLASLAAGLGISLREASIARIARSKAEEAATLAREERTLAERNGAEADQQAHRAENALAVAERRFDDEHHLATDVLLKLNQSLGNLPGATKVRTDAAKASAEYLDRMAQDAAGDPKLQSDLAHAYYELAEITGNPLRINNGDSKAALDLYSKSRAIYQHLLQKDPTDTESRRGLAQTYKGTGIVLASLARYDEASVAHKQAIALLEPLASESNQAALDFADALVTYASALTTAERYPEVLKVLSRVKPVVGPPGTPPGTDEARLQLLANVASLTSQAKEKTLDSAGGLEAAVEALRIRDQLHAASPGNLSLTRDLVLAYGRLGDRFFNEELRTGHATREGSLRYYQRARELALETSRADETDQRAKLDVAASTSRYARSLGLVGDDTGSITATRESIAAFEKLAASGNTFALGSAGLDSSDLGEALQKRGDLDAAAAAYRRSTEIGRIFLARNPGDDPGIRMLIKGQFGLANLQAARGSASAESLVSEVLAAVEKYRAAATNANTAQIRTMATEARAAQVFEKLAKTTGSAEYTAKAKTHYKAVLDSWTRMPPTVREAAGADLRQFAETARIAITE